MNESQLSPRVFCNYIRDRYLNYSQRGIPFILIPAFHCKTLLLSNLK